MGFLVQGHGHPGGVQGPARHGELRDKVKAVEAGEAKLRTQERQLRDSLAEKETLLREIHHRVRNNLQVVLSLSSLQAEAFHDPRDRAMQDITAQRIRSMVHIRDGTRAVLAVEGRGFGSGMEPGKTMSMGFVLVRSLAAQLGAELSFSATPGLGVRLTFTTA